MSHTVLLTEDDEEESTSGIPVVALTAHALAGDRAILSKSEPA